jgi:hypothetical protein
MEHRSGVRPEIVYAVVFLTETDARTALTQAEDATGIAEGHERWYVVRDESSSS